MVSRQIISSGDDIRASGLPGGGAPGKGAVFGGYEARSLAPGVGRYVDLVVFYFDHVEAGGAAGADAVGDGPRGGDYEAVHALLDGVYGVLVVVAAEDQLRAEVGEGVEGLLRVGQAVAAGELAPYGVVVDHHDAGRVGGGVVEGFPETQHVGVLDVPYNPQVPEAARDRTPRDAVGRVDAGDDRAGDLQGGAQLLRDVPLVFGVLEAVGLLPEEPRETEVARHGPEPADVVVAGDDHAGRHLFERIQVGARFGELRVRAALGQVAGDGHRVGPVLLDEPPQGIEALGYRGPPEVQIRNVHEGGHEKRFYPNTPGRQTWPVASHPTFRM